MSAFVDYLRMNWPIEEYNADIKVKSVFCYVITPEMQRMGIATKLLEHVVKDASDEGFDLVEAYVNKKYIHEDHDYHGLLEMYEKCGFTKCAEREGKVVVRKALMK